MAIPTDISSCKVWHTSDTGVTITSGKVSQWDDRTGLGNHSTQGTAGSRPTPVTRAYPNFVEIGTFGSSYWLDMASLSLNSRALSVFAVLRYRTSELNTALSTFNCLCSFPSTGASFLWNDNSANTNRIQVFNSVVPVFSARAGTWTTPHVVGFTSGTGNFKYYDGPRVVSTSAASNNNWTGGRIGKYSGAIGLGDCYISAFLLFDAELTSAEALSMVAYLQSWAGRATNPISQAVICGDSIHAGESFYSNDTPNVAERLGIAMPNIRVHSLAKSSTTFHGGSGGGATQGPYADGLMHADYTKSFIVNNHGTNNIRVTGDDLTTLIARRTTWNSDRATAASSGSYSSNLVKVICTIPYREDAGWTAGMETERQAYNADCRDPAKQASEGFIVCDYAARSEFSSYTTTYYQTDKLHPNATGTQLQADMLAATIGAYLGGANCRRFGLSSFAGMPLEVGREGVRIF